MLEVGGVRQVTSAPGTVRTSDLWFRRPMFLATKTPSTLVGAHLLCVLALSDVGQLWRLSPRCGSLHRANVRASRAALNEQVNSVPGEQVSLHAGQLNEFNLLLAD